MTNANPTNHLPGPRRLATVAEVATYMDVTERTIRNWISRGLLPAYRVRGTRGVRLDLREVDRAAKLIPAVAQPTFRPSARITDLPRQAEVVYPTDGASS